MLRKKVIFLLMLAVIILPGISWRQGFSSDLFIRDSFFYVVLGAAGWFFAKNALKICGLVFLANVFALLDLFFPLFPGDRVWSAFQGMSELWRFCIFVLAEILFIFLAWVSFKEANGGKIAQV